MMGDLEVKPTILENKMKIISRRSIVALNDIKIGETFTDKNIGMRRPGTGLPPIMFESLLGQKAKKSIKKFKNLQDGDF